MEAEHVLLEIAEILSSAKWMNELISFTVLC